MCKVSIRSYERKDLPLEQRLPSLARRFSCLDKASGIEPWNPEKLNSWTKTHDESSAQFQTGIFLLNLAQYKTTHRFDILKAAAVWCEQDAQMFVNFMRIWEF